MPSRPSCPSWAPMISFRGANVLHFRNGVLARYVQSTLGCYICSSFLKDSPMLRRIDWLMVAFTGFFGYWLHSLVVLVCCDQTPSFSTASAVARCRYCRHVVAGGWLAGWYTRGGHGSRDDHVTPINALSTHFPLHDYTYITLCLAHTGFIATRCAHSSLYARIMSKVQIYIYTLESHMRQGMD